MVLPTVLLHDHLDGGLRVDTVLDLADGAGIRLPRSDPGALGEWFDQGRSGSLESYLEAFRYTVAVMQTPEAIRLVARQSLEDLASDGVAYAELRFAPLLNVDEGLAPEAVVESALEGFAQASAHTGIHWGLILDAMRDRPGSDRVAGLCLRYADAGVVGFDLAGRERGYPPDEHLAAIRAVRSAGLGVTLHAGEDGGVDSIRRALHFCGADRIGHGVEIIDDCVVENGRLTSFGPLASELIERAIPMEVCVTSNLHTKGWSPSEHPVGLLYRGGFNVTVNTDNRLMSSTSMSKELSVLAEWHEFGINDVAKVTRAALEAAFCPDHVKTSIWNDIIAPRLTEVGVEVSPRP